MTGKPPDAEKVAADLNRQFHETGTGVLTRLMSPLPDSCNDHSCEAWKLEYAKSFLLMNTYSWSKSDSRYQVFRGHDDVHPYGWPGFIASQHALKHMVDCCWSGDGASLCRNKDAVGSTPANCGCADRDAGSCPNGPDGKSPSGKVHCSQPDDADWCGVSPHSWFCTYQPTAIDKMLEEFKNKGGGDSNKGYTKNYGYNEVLVSSDKWAAALPDSVWAFLVPRDCPPASQCYNSFAFWYADWKAKYGPWPIVQFDAKQRSNPYSALPQPTYVPERASGFCHSGECAACPGDGTETCMGDECCSDGSICPSASPSFNGCKKPKKHVDCLDACGPSPPPSPIPAGQCGTSQLYLQCTDCEGDDIDNLPMDNPDDCCSWCAETDGCTAFVHNMADGHGQPYSYLKGSCKKSKRSRKRGATAGVGVSQLPGQRRRAPPPTPGCCSWADSDDCGSTTPYCKANADHCKTCGGHWVPQGAPTSGCCSWADDNSCGSTTPYCKSSADHCVTCGGHWVPKSGTVDTEEPDWEEFV